ncbi:MAG: DUF6311 domain-containing protein [Treponema sp.]|nr:DUF6311 domain-containing protein [Treponema sp.]
MTAKIYELLGNKIIKYSFLIILLFGVFASVIIMIPQVRDIIINFIETAILHRNLSSLDKWNEYLFSIGYNFLFYFIVIFCLLFVKKNKLASFWLLLSVLIIYLIVYILHIPVFNSLDRLRFPLVCLLTVIIIYILKNKNLFLKNEKIDLIKNKLSVISQNKNISDNTQSFICFVCGGIMGALFFIYVFGIIILDFTYTDWLMTGGDLSQHYLGWKLFRNSSWYFPIGLMDNIVHPYNISIIYSDSIPLFAVIFKIISPLLPENFQYFGLFGILCYILQGGIGVLIIKRIGGNNTQALIGSSLIIMSTVMLFRLFFHTSLAAHFIILLCILECLSEYNRSFKKHILIWGVLVFLAVAIHIYYIPMVFLFLLFRIYFIKERKIKIAVLGISIIITIITMHLFGAFNFIRASNTAETFLDEATSNINAFINPLGKSAFLSDLPQIGYFQYEGNAYLGLGIILALLFIISNHIYLKNKIDLNIDKKYIKPFNVLFFAFLFLSFSPTITFNEYKLFTYQLIPPFDWVWSIFRSTGRFSWPIVYIIVIFCIYWMIKRFSIKKSILFLIILLSIQWMDLQIWFNEKGGFFRTKYYWQSGLQSPAWDNLANDYSHLFFMNDNHNNSNSYLHLAGKYKLTVNDAYLARKNTRMIEEYKEKTKIYLLENGPKENVIYIFDDLERISLFTESGLYFYLIDNEVIGISSQKNYLFGYEYY